MFAGIGGFRSGLEAVGGFRCVGYCEIDPYPRRAYEALYDTTEEVYYISWWLYETSDYIVETSDGSQKWDLRERPV